MKYIVDKTAWQEACNGIICCNCSMSDGTGACRIGEYIQKQAVYEKPEKPQWIPCTERLPEENDRYVVWCEWIDEEGYECGEYNVASFYNGHWYGKHLRKVIAWMPLPEPYKKEGEKK